MVLAFVLQLKQPNSGWKELFLSIISLGDRSAGGNLKCSFPGAACNQMWRYVTHFYMEIAVIGAALHTHFREHDLQREELH